MAEEKISISKAESNPNPSDSRIVKGEVGNPYIRAIGGFVDQSKKVELQYPKCLDTFDEMCSNGAIAQGLTVGEVFLTKALLGAKFQAGVSRSEKSQDFADYLNWNIHNLEGGGWYEAITNIITFRKYGFSWVEKVFAKNNSIKHKDKYPYKISKLSPRPQKSVREWIWKDPTTKRDLIGLAQWKPVDTVSPFYTSQQVQDLTNEKIRRDKFMLFSWNSTGGNPQGKSDLVDCYISWKELQMISSYEVVGVAKDLGGLLVLRAPSEHINKAIADPDSDEGLALAAMQKNAAAIHAGDQTYILLGSDVQGEGGNGKLVYDIELKGIDGGGKQYKTTELIDARKKDILNALGAGFLILGQDGVGSYALADSKNSLHAFFMERILLFIADVFQREFVKSLATINGIQLEEDDMPTMMFGELDQADPQERAKVVQLMSGVGFLVKDKSIIIQAHKQAGYDTTEIEKLTEEQLLSKLTPDTARVGESGGSSGTGGTQQGGITSATNSGNKV